MGVGDASSSVPRSPRKLVAMSSYDTCSVSLNLLLRLPASGATRAASYANEKSRVWRVTESFESSLWGNLVTT